MNCFCSTSRTNVSNITVSLEYPYLLKIALFDAANMTISGRMEGLRENLASGKPDF
jgi:hypothetical protein